MYRVTGYFAFGSRTDEKLIMNIRNGRLMESDRFKQLSVKCRNLVYRMLRVDPNQRYSAEEALNDEWFRSDEESSYNSPPNEMPIVSDSSLLVSSKRMNEG